MAELQSLRSRIEKVNLNLKAAHSARARESEALTALWQQIRTRYTEQEQELVHLRHRTAELEDTKDELLAIVGHLLETMEGTMAGIDDGTVPKISKLASELLASEEGTASEPAAGRTQPTRPAEHAPEPKKAIEAPPTPPEQTQSASPTDSVGESLSPGIRTLIGRIQGVFDEDQNEVEYTEIHDAGEAEDVESGDGLPEAEPAEEDLSRDLQEIEKLRDELQGLRRRISTSGE